MVDPAVMQRICQRICAWIRLFQFKRVRLMCLLKSPKAQKPKSPKAQKPKSHRCFDALREQKLLAIKLPISSA
jgi:hypothetical protein